MSCGSGKIAAAEMGTNMEDAHADAELDTLVTNYELDESIFPNPERGFYIYPNSHELDSDIGSRRDEGYSLVWGRVDMEAYRLPPPGTRV